MNISIWQYDMLVIFHEFFSLHAIAEIRINQRMADLFQMTNINNHFRNALKQKYMNAPLENITTGINSFKYKEDSF
jgi:hypothetical protein